MVAITYQGQTFQSLPGESVLDTLIRGGTDARFSCRKGTCHICVLRVRSGEPGAPSRRGLRPELVDHGHFLPCCAFPTSDLEVAPPDLSGLTFRLRLAERTALSTSVVQLSFEPETQVDWRPGQFINLRRTDGVTRSYSITSIGELDYFLSIHVKRIDGGSMSPWLCDEVSLGDCLDAQGPVGTCTYDAEDRAQPMLMLGTGTGLSPLLGIARDALRKGHTGDIWIYHGSRHADGLYHREALAKLSERHPNVRCREYLTGDAPCPDGVHSGRIVPAAFQDHPDLSGFRVYLCGIPAMVEEGRYRAVLAGASRRAITADAFAFGYDRAPTDRAILKSIEPDPELWAALDEGRRLTGILTAFYHRVFDDPLLAPFFHKITKQRAIEQQYSFLADTWAGTRNYFGLKPFNAHHWMVISDELFDYREELLESVLREHGLPEWAVRRIAAFDERFRSNIVKSSARGLFIDGAERRAEPPRSIEVDIDSVCDGCHRAIERGQSALYHADGGKLFCARCTTPA